MTELTARFQVLAVNDSADFCECCGRKNLKRVVWVLDRETGAEKHFGTSCVLSPRKSFGIRNEVKAAIRGYENDLKVRNRYAQQDYYKAGGSFVPNPTRRGYFVPTHPELWERSKTRYM